MAKKFRNEKYYRKLSKKERRQFRKNCDNDKIHSFKETMNHDFIKNFAQFIGGAFDWYNSPEGGSYWSLISRRFN